MLAIINDNILVSIHASVKDATEQGADGTIIIKVSIHASVKDATTATTGHFPVCRFQSTHL